MQVLSVESLLHQLIAIASISGEEKKVAEYISWLLKEFGLVVEHIPVAKDRYNVWAQKGDPKILLQAHMDVVPPHIGPREDTSFIYGRGACDTKGCIASMLVAARQALEEGADNFGLLFTVGEEVDFAGAIKAVPKIESTNPFIIVGEPTELIPVTAHYGILVMSLVTRGKSAHSSRPHLGINAIDALIELLSGPVKKLKVSEGTLMSLVHIEGGIADNIIPDEARALFSLRIAPEDTLDYPLALQQLVKDKARVEAVQSLPPVASYVPESLAFLGEGQSVTYCTELNFFKHGLVLGPGSISDAHSPDEKVSKSQLHQAVKIYKKIIYNFTNEQKNPVLHK